MEKNATRTKRRGTKAGDARVREVRAREGRVRKAKPQEATVRPIGHHLGSNLRRPIRGSQIHLSMNSFLSEKVKAYMAAHNVTITELMRKALTIFLNQDENYWNLVFKNLEHTSMEVRTMHGELLRLTNFFIHFVYYWFMLWPDTDPDQRKDLIEKAFVMAERFSKSFKRRLAAGGYVVDFNMQDLKELILDSAPELDPLEVHEFLEQERNEKKARESSKDGNGGKENNTQERADIEALNEDLI